MAATFCGSTPSKPRAVSMAALASSSQASGVKSVQPASYGVQLRKEKMKTPYETSAGSDGNQVGSHQGSEPGFVKGFFNPRFCSQGATSYQSLRSPPTQCMKTTTGAGDTAAG